MALAAAVIGKCGRTASQTAALNTNRAGGREQKEKSAIRWLGASEALDLALCPGAGVAENPPLSAPFLGSADTTSRRAGPVGKDARFDSTCK